MKPGSDFSIDPWGPLNNFASLRILKPKPTDFAKYLNKEFNKIGINI